MKSLPVKVRTLLVVILKLNLLGQLQAQNEEKKKTMDILGFIQMDAGYNANQIDPNWFDAMRPTKLPAYKNEFGTDGNFYASVRQTRLGFKNYLETPMGPLKTYFEFDMFGTGPDVGQTTIHLRHAYAELGKFGAGQYWSNFMDIDIFPNTLEYWGPSGMAFFRNVQFRYMPIQGATRLSFALERPGASADQGIYAGRVELANVKPRFPFPDLTAEYRQAMKWGYVKLAGIIRRLEWVDQGTGPSNLSGKAAGWGFNLSTNIKIVEGTVFKGSVVYGQGVENYMNDAPVDVAIKNSPGNVTAPIKGVALPVLGIVAFVDHTWSEKFTSSIGYSMISTQNSDGQNPNDFHQGDYILANLLYHPVQNAMMGVEYQHADRKNFSDGFTSQVSKVQFSFRYNFSQSFYK